MKTKLSLHQIPVETAQKPMAAGPCAAAEQRSVRRMLQLKSACDPLLTAAEAASETGRALSTFWRDVKRGDLPPAYYVTPRMPRWRQSELRAVVDASPRKPVQ